MKVKSSLIFILLLFTIGINAQEPVYKNFNWGEVPQIPSGVSDEKLILNNTEIVEFIFEGDYFVEYQIKHNIEFINSDEQVKLNNKKYVPYGNSSELIEAKVRVVKPNQEVSMLDDSKILTAIDENTGLHYKYFALEGLESGCIIDYYYVIRKNPSYRGTRKFIQDEYPTKEYNFKLYSPKHLEFLFKVYNDTNHVVLDTTITDKNCWVLKLQSVEGLKDEELSPYATMLKQLVYKIDKNNANHTKNLSSLGIASTNIYVNIYNTLDKKDEKALTSFMKNIEFFKNAGIEDKIVAIENYVKDNINLVGNDDPNYSKISSIIKLRSASETGIIRLLVRLFQLSHVEHQLVLTSDRTNTIFDKDFESFHYLTSYLIYFPETKKYIAPGLFEYRYNLIPWELTDTYGLFIKETSLGEYKTGIGQVNYIEPLDYTESYHNIEAAANILPGFSQIELNLKISSKGYYAVFTQPYFNLFNEETKNDFMKDIFDQFFPESKVNDWKVENGETRYIGKKPFIQVYNSTLNELIDIAGDRYLFKVGQLIGQQVELYSESERKLPVNDRYKRSFRRKLVVTIPEGYSVKNLDDLIFSVDYVKDGKRVLLFESKYTFDNQTIVIDIIEYYDQIQYELNEYESYRKVVNSAADFEKVVLVIEKEE